MPPQVLSRATEVRAWADNVHRSGERIVLVPTMGYLHEGHLSLVEAARQHGDRVIVSIFVNPTQFGANEDLGNYPRDMDGDLNKLAPYDVDAVFTPTPQEVYPRGFATYIVPEQLSERLCGASRPGHFRGVCTVVAILFRITRCHCAVFGEKDYQQLQIIRRMARDLWLDVDVIGAPIVRERDGLAMSSRNTYLSPQERSQALALHATLRNVAKRFADGDRDAVSLESFAKKQLSSAEGIRLEYAELVDAETLQPVEARVTRPAILAVAARVGKTRLIDNQHLS